jgi:hypothetical integral membrane protein (TIGR02206 family)
MQMIEVIGPTFTLFGPAHIAALAVVATLAALLARAPARDRPGSIAWSISLLLLAQEVIKQYYFNVVAGQPWPENLPLALCRANEFLCMFMLLRRSYAAFEVAYFWALSATVLAMLTPDLGTGFPDPRFLLFFFGHGLVLLAVVYAVAAYQFRPTLHSVWRAVVITLGYTLLIAVVNLALDTNYLFLREKPESASAMDFFGPWPIYLVVAAAVAVLLFLLSYLPFRLSSQLAQRPSQRS